MPNGYLTLIDKNIEYIYAGNNEPKKESAIAVQTMMLSDTVCRNCTNLSLKAFVIQQSQDVFQKLVSSSATRISLPGVAQSEERALDLTMASVPQDSASSIHSVSGAIYEQVENKIP